MRVHVLIVFALFMVCFGFSQTNLLIKNVNYRAKELKHNLNASEDTLQLESTHTIFKVEIYNDDFSKTVNVDGNAVDIALNNLPEGRFIIETVLKDKLIIMTLIRAKTTDGKDSDSYMSAVALNKTGKKEQEEQESISLKAKGNEKINMSSNDSRKYKIPKSYWVEYIISNGNSSYKTLRFASKTLVDKMVAKNKLEVKSVKGKQNQLTIWEIYDTTKFLRFKRLNPNFSTTPSSEYFNVEPYYDSKTYMANL